MTVQTPATVRAGLTLYGNYERSWPQEDAAGVPDFASKAPDLHEAC